MPFIWFQSMLFFSSEQWKLIVAFAVIIIKWISNKFTLHSLRGQDSAFASLHCASFQLLTSFQILWISSRNLACYMDAVLNVWEKWSPLHTLQVTLHVLCGGYIPASCFFGSSFVFAYMISAFCHGFFSTMFRGVIISRTPRDLQVERYSWNVVSLGHYYNWTP